ncbi:MAG: hypothetical protein ABSA49_01295 [Rhizomicrobium sp.]
MNPVIYEQPQIQEHVQLEIKRANMIRSRHGLGPVRRLMQQIGGMVRVVSDRGTKWTLAFPRTGEGLTSDVA